MGTGKGVVGIVVMDGFTIAFYFFDDADLFVLVIGKRGGPSSHDGCPIVLQGLRLAFREDFQIRCLLAIHDLIRPCGCLALFISSQYARSCTGFRSTVFQAMCCFEDERRAV